MKTLQIELTALREVDFNLDLMGFAEEELARLLAEQQSLVGLTDEDAAPGQPEVPVTVTGDLWNLGNHKLLVGNATVQTDVERLMRAEAADLVFSDPPYNVDYEGYTEQKLKIKGDRVQKLRRRGKTLRAIAVTLNLQGHRTRRGSEWRLESIARVVRRAASQ
jgi:hypothetical protein